MSSLDTDIDHRRVIAQLSGAERRALTEKADGPALLRLFLHFGAIAGLGTAVGFGVPFWPLLLPPLGILVVFLFTLEHEAIHETAFRTPFLNKAAAAAAGFLLAVPPNWFRFFHFAHHRHTHDPDNDPELMSPEPRTPGQYALYLSGFPLWKGMATVLVANALGRNRDAFVPARGRSRVRAEARLMLGLYALLLAGSLLAGSALLFWCWVLPALLGQPFLRAYLLAEHARCPHVANMLENTRTTFTNSLVRLLAWNMPFHAEHHAFPAVPFHKLPAFHRITAEHLRVTQRGYARFHGGLMREMSERP